MIVTNFDSLDLTTMLHPTCASRVSTITSGFLKHRTILFRVCLYLNWPMKAWRWKISHIIIWIPGFVPISVDVSNWSMWWNLAKVGGTAAHIYWSPCHCYSSYRCGHEHWASARIQKHYGPLLVSSSLVSYMLRSKVWFCLRSLSPLSLGCGIGLQSQTIPATGVYSTITNWFV